MSLLPLLNFAGGELDPVLHDKATLDKFRNGLATARNVTVTKIGSVISRFPTYNLRTAKNANQKIKIYCPPNSGHLLEWGHNYVRVYAFDIYGLEAPVSEYRLPYLTYYGEYAHALVEADLDNMHFTTTGDHVYVFVSGKATLKFKLAFGASAFVAGADIFKIPVAPATITAVSAGTPAGIPVNYKATVLVNGEESEGIATSAAFNTPIANGQTNTIKIKFPNNGQYPWVNEVRLYSRPVGGGAYGYLGSTTSWVLVDANANYEYTFIDFGYVPDYGNGEQAIITEYGLNNATVPSLNAKTGIVYQGRLLKVPAANDEAILASRPGFLNNFYRDFPYAADSALLFKAARSGKAKIIRMLDHEGLIVFTTNGVYTSGGLLSVDNLALTKRGKWVINETIPPLVVPNGVFFVDTANTIRQLIYNDQLVGYESTEQTIFSNHIFKDRTIKTWCFQDGVNPVILVSFDDGTIAMFTYNFEHKMTAWTRGDSKYPVEQFEESGENDYSFLVVNKNGQRYIEVSLPRYLLPQYRSGVGEIEMYPQFAFMDGMKTFNGFLNGVFSGTQKFTITPVVAGNWSGNLTISNDAGFYFNQFVAGSTIRWFDPADYSAIDLTVVSVQNVLPYNIVVTPATTFPSAYASGPRLYEAKNVITGLAHLNGESVSIMVDGYLVTSPYNTIEGYPTATVSGGSVTIPGSLKGAIVHVGRPIVADVKTLPATTVEQGPTTIESMTNNKLYVKVNDSRGLYIGNKFPEEINKQVDGTSVAGMESLDEALVPENDPLVGNKYLEPISKRCERVIPGSWDNQGSVAIRQVDPLHFEILSIISDLEILLRRNK